jgi:hypothetical protein
MAAHLGLGFENSQGCALFKILRGHSMKKVALFSYIDGQSKDVLSAMTQKT